MKKSLDFLEQMSNENYSQLTCLKYNKNINESVKQIQAQITVLNWANEMVYFYIQKEKHFLKEFLEEIHVQKNQVSVLKSSEYKQALLKQLNELERKINERINSNK